MTILVTGANGQLGFDLMRELSERGHTTFGTDISGQSAFKNFVRADLTKAEEVNRLFEIVMPDSVIHCAGWTAVDEAEKNENFEKVFSTNVLATRNVAIACREHNAKMIYISTDYVFDGSGDQPWKEDCKAFAPLNTYGMSKLCGEFVVSAALEKYFVVRISWAFGIKGKNFVKTMLELEKRGLKEISVVEDQIGSITYTKDLSVLISDMAETDKYGFYHATNGGDFVSWADVAREIFRITGSRIIINGVPSSKYKTLAIRPKNSRLSKDKLEALSFKPLPDWKDALKRYIEDLKNDA